MNKVKLEEVIGILFAMLGDKILLGTHVRRGQENSCESRIRC